LVWPACAAITVLRVVSGTYIDVTSHLRMDEILAGACVATLPADRMRAGAASFLLWMLTVCGWAVTSHPDSGWLQYLRPYASGFLLVATISQGSNGLIKVLSGPPLRYIANISYALYVIHPLTAHGWWNDGSIWQRYLLKRPLGFAITLVAAHLSTFYWERTWLDLARRRLRGRKAEEAQAAAQLQSMVTDEKVTALPN
jgi:peptidoglycan/LPS O-acetylase OafA/YrhL